MTEDEIDDSVIADAQELTLELINKNEKMISALTLANADYFLKKRIQRGSDSDSAQYYLPEKKLSQREKKRIAHQKHHTRKPITPFESMSTDVSSRNNLKFELPVKHEVSTTKISSFNRDTVNRFNVPSITPNSYPYRGQ
jgi:uncharacterized membrane protein YfhO